jgi:hypothetical protein
MNVTYGENPNAEESRRFAACLTVGKFEIIGTGPDRATAKQNAIKIALRPFIRPGGKTEMWITPEDEAELRAEAAKDHPALASEGLDSRVKQ